MGGQVDIEEHHRLGERIDVDVSYQYLSYFLENDDELKKIHDMYEFSEILLSKLKKLAIKELWAYIERFQQH